MSTQSTPATERRLTALDHARLHRLVGAGTTPASAPTGLADPMRELLDGAELLPTADVPADLVTMRSKVCVTPSSGEVLTLELSYPDEADAAAGRLSVLSPLGLALLGARVGDVIRWDSPDGRVHHAQLLSLPYQPEAAGDLLR